MVKYSFEFKLKIVQEYIDGQVSCYALKVKYKISDTQIRRWVDSYLQKGIEGLQRSRQNKVYDSNFKLNAVNLYLTSEKSYRELAQELGIVNVPMYTRWVTEYRKYGELAFSKPRGRPRKGKTLPMNPKLNLPEENLEFLELQQENLRLRIENEYLKGLRRLRMEQQVKEKPNLFSSSNKNISSPSKKY